MLAEWLVVVALADCSDGPVPPARIAALLDQADAAFAALDIPRFLDDSDAVRAAIPCLGAVPEPALVARIHRTEGLRLFGERNVDSVRAFAAARRIEPGYAFPAELVPPGSPILADYAAMDLSSAGLESMPAPAEGQLYVDGAPTRERDGELPALVQLVVDGAPAWSAYLESGVRPQPYDAHRSPARSEPARAAIRTPLAVAAGAVAAASVAAYGGAWSTRGRWADPSTPDAELAGLRSKTNALSVTSAVCGATALGLGAWVVVSW